MCTATDCLVLRQSSGASERGPFDLHLPGGFSFLPTWEYLVPGAQRSAHHRITIWGIYRGLVIRCRGLIYVYIIIGLWRRYNYAAVARRGPEVQFQDVMMRERINGSAAVLNLVNVVLVIGNKHPHDMVRVYTEWILCTSMPLHVYAHSWFYRAEFTECNWI